MRIPFRLEQNAQRQGPTPGRMKRCKPFRLVKYFTFSSLIFVFLGAIVLSALTSHWARAMQLKKSEDYALLAGK